MPAWRRHLETYCGSSSPAGGSRSGTSPPRSRSSSPSSGSRWGWRTSSSYPCRSSHSARRSGTCRSVGRMTQLVSVSVEAGIATIRLDRPPMNALNVEVQEGLRDAAREVSGDEAVRAVVVYGGEKVFAAGADIKEMAAMSYVDMAAR